MEEALKFMGRPADEKVTRDIGRDICTRQGLKAMIVGSISALGSSYAIQLEAVEAETGSPLAIEQIEAAKKEEIVRQLGIAATNLRRKIGEHLSTTEKFDVPLEQATTSSLEAWKAFSPILTRFLLTTGLQEVLGNRAKNVFLGARKGDKATNFESVFGIPQVNPVESIEFAEGGLLRHVKFSNFHFQD